MDHYEKALMFIAAVLLLVGAWLLHGQPSATASILLGITIFSAGVARYRHRQQKCT